MKLQPFDGWLRAERNVHNGWSGLGPLSRQGIGKVGVRIAIRECASNSWPRRFMLVLADCKALEMFYRFVKPHPPCKREEFPWPMPDAYARADQPRPIDLELISPSPPA
jgi:hypothetical protein